MLHHLVFTNGGPDDKRRDPGCPHKPTRERFWGTSEELRALTLPPGYGYPTDPTDIWRAILMVMHHRAGERQFFLEYRVTVDPRPTIPVKPYWLSIDPVLARPAVDGARRRHEDAPPLARVHDARGGPDRRRRRPPARRRAVDLMLSQPRCGDRTLVSNQPAYAPADDPLYQVRPLLHEPDPKNISWWQSATGLADPQGRAAEGHRGLRQHAPAHARDGDRARLRRAAARRGAPPAARPRRPTPQILGAEFADARTDPAEGRRSRSPASAPTASPAPTTAGAGDAALGRGQRRLGASSHDFTFGPPQLTVRRGATVRWHFADDDKHDVTLAAGPRRLRLTLAEGRRPLRPPLHQARHLPAPVLAARGLHVAGRQGQARTTAPPRRGSPPPLNARVSWWRSTAWQPPKNRLGSRNQAIVRPLSAASSMPGSA